MDSPCPEELLKKIPETLMSSSNSSKKQAVNNFTKGQKDFKINEENTLIELEKKNIESLEKNLTQKFDPPHCINCPNRKGDRVCINKECGPVKYMQIICGKCHSDVHSKATKKPEIDIEEYLIKMTTFMNEQKNKKDLRQSMVIDKEHLKLALEDLNKIRKHLGSLKSKLRSEIEGYQSPSQIHQLLQISINKALSHCSYDNIQEHLKQIKRCVLFENNNFLWNDMGQKCNSFIKTLQDVDYEIGATKKTIQKSFIGGDKINLEEQQFKLSVSLSQGFQGGPIIINNGEVKLGEAGQQCQAQFYLDYKLDPEKKYKMRFRFLGSTLSYIMVGIMPFSMVNSQYVYNVSDEYFCKRFFCTAPDHECARIVRGSNLSYLPNNGYQVEMRVDLQENYLDFSDYPEHQNINANHQHYKLKKKQHYVIAFTFFNNQSLVIESFEELTQLEQI